MDGVILSRGGPHRRPRGTAQAEDKAMESSRWLRWIMRWGGGIAVAVGLAGICLTTEPEPRHLPLQLLNDVLWLCQAGLCGQFLIRLLASRRTGQIRAYLASTSGLVDAIAALAVPLAFAGGARAPDLWLVGIVWVLKPINAAPGLRQLNRVLVREARSLGSVACLFVIILFLAATALYVLERAGQPAEFGSLPQSLWWAVVTLTTTGYGDVIPKSIGGRLIASAVMIFGLGIFGLWTGIMATGFAAEARRQDFLGNWELVAKVPFLHSLNASGMAMLAQSLRRLDVPANTILFRRGQDGDCMYFVVSGEVEVDVLPSPVRLGPGNFFGEMALLGGGKRSATVSTIRPATLLVLDVMDFRTLAAHHTELAAEVEAEANRRATGGPAPS